MKIVLIIYGISLLLLIAMLIVSGYFKYRDPSEKHKWYITAIFIALAPFSVAFILYDMISSYITDMKETKAAPNREESGDVEEDDIVSAMAELNAAKSKPQESHSFVNVMTAQPLVEKIKKKDYDSFMRYLTHLSLPGGVSLHVKECTDNGLGDESKLYLKTPESKYELNIWDYIKAENSIDGAWDAYFLYIVWHFLPLWWHANYNKRTYLFSKEDADEIQLFYGREEELHKIKKAIKPLVCDPEVIEANKGYFFVCCCYWTNFGGLIKETVRVHISEEGKVSFKEIEKLTLHKYECGIRF